jgi:hypothetical protein
LGTQNSVFNGSSITTLAVTGGTAVISGGLAAWYTWVMLARVKKRHEQEVGKEAAGKRGEGVLAAMKEVTGMNNPTPRRPGRV